MDESETPAEPGDAGGHAAPELAWAAVVLAALESSHAAERIVASLGRDFRQDARKGTVAAFVVTRNRDGSFRLVRSRVVTASGLVAAGISFSASVLAGFRGSLSALRGAKAVTGSARQRQSRVRHEDHRLAEILDDVGRRSAAALLLCCDEETGRTAMARVADRGSRCAGLSPAEFLAALDRLGDDYDWVRRALADAAAEQE